jgi:hypothetical protein
VRSDFLFRSRRGERREDNATKAEQKDKRVAATFDEQWSFSFQRRKEVEFLFFFRGCVMRDFSDLFLGF